MIDFSLSHKPDKTFPAYVKAHSGECFFIEPNYRVILKILRLYADDDVIESHKLSLSLKWFYKDNYPSDLKEALNLLYDFIRGAKKAEKYAGKNPKPRFCYEFDAEEIYASFVQQYHIDLLDIDFMHWFKFQILLANLSQDSPFYRKIDLRFADLRGYKGESYTKMARMKRSVQLPVKYSKDEEKALADILKILK